MSGITSNSLIDQCADPNIDLEFVEHTETQQKVIPPTFDVPLRPVELPEGTSAIFEVRVSGLPTPTVTWFKDDKPLEGSSDYIISHIENTHSVKIRKLNKAVHSGRFLCRATNPSGEAESVATVQVICESIVFPDVQNKCTNVYSHKSIISIYHP